MKSALYLLIFFLCLGFVLAAEPPVLPTLFYGKVVDINGNPITNQKVTVDWTDSNGGAHSIYVFTFTRDEALSKGNVGLEGYYLFSNGDILAADGLKIRITAGERNVEIDAQPGNNLFEVSPIVFYGVNKKETFWSSIGDFVSGIVGGNSKKEIGPLGQGVQTGDAGTANQNEMLTINSGSESDDSSENDDNNNNNNMAPSDTKTDYGLDSIVDRNGGVDSNNQASDNLKSDSNADNMSSGKTSENENGAMDKKQTQNSDDRNSNTNTSTINQKSFTANNNLNNQQNTNKTINQDNDEQTKTEETNNQFAGKNANAATPISENRVLYIILAIIFLIVFFSIIIFFTMKSSDYEDKIDSQRKLEEMFLSPIKDIMTENVICVSIDEELGYTASVMLKNKINAVFVVSNNKIKGVLSEGDIFFKTKDSKDMAKGVKDLMTTGVSTIELKSNIYYAGKQMINSSTRKLPVLADDSVVGIVTETDILKHLFSISMQHLELDANQLVISLMNKNFIKCDISEQTSEVLSKMRMKHEEFAVILDNEKPVGIFTTRDYLHLLVDNPDKLANSKIDEVMSRPVFTINATENIIDAAVYQRQKGYRHLIVMNNGKVVGIISQSKIMEKIYYMFFSLGSKGFKKRLLKQ